MYKILATALTTCCLTQLTREYEQSETSVHQHHLSSRDVPLLRPVDYFLSNPGRGQRRAFPAPQNEGPSIIRRVYRGSNTLSMKAFPRFEKRRLCRFADKMSGLRSKSSFSLDQYNNGVQKQTDRALSSRTPHYLPSDWVLLTSICLQLVYP